MTDSTNIEDGGPAFPCAEDHKVAAELLWTQGMSKRELFAAILMHGEFAARDSDEIMDEIATNAALGADALLRALSEPRPEPAPAFPTFNSYAASSEQKEALRSLQTRTWFEALPHALRTYVTDAVDSIARADAGEDDLPF